LFVARHLFAKANDRAAEGVADNYYHSRCVNEYPVYTMKQT